MNAARLPRHCLFHGIALALMMPATAWSQEAAQSAASPKVVGVPASEERSDSSDQQPAQQTQAALDLQGVQVKGVRAALTRSNDLKRDAATVQDSITALELGKFPDDNVADSLSHITGVSISRTAGGEGQQVSIRGLGPEYTLSTFNGRILATDGAGRYFAYDVLPSDVISGADVIKGAEAVNMEGGIGGLVNLRSASPFDRPGQHGAVRVEGDRNQMSDLNGHKFSGVYSNTFAHDTLGVMVGVVSARRRDRTDSASTNFTRNPDPTTGWYGNAWGGDIDPNGNGVLDQNEYGLVAPGQFQVGSIVEDKKRTAYSGKIEWRPNDDFKLTVDGLKTRLNSPQVGYYQSYYPQYSPGRWSNVTVQNGIVTGMTLDNPDPSLALNPEVMNVTNHRVVDTAMYGANAQWKVSDDFTLASDVYRSTSRRHSGGQDTYVVLRMNQPNTTQIALNGGIPDVTTVFDDGRELASGLANGQFSESDFNTHYLELSGDNIDDRIDGGTLGGDLFVGAGHVDHIKFGVDLTDRRKSRDLITNTINGGSGYYEGANVINVSELGSNFLSSVSYPNFMSGSASSFPRSFLAFDTDAYLAALKAYDGHARADGSAYDYSAAAPEWDPLESYRVTEKTSSFYVQADLSGERWDGNVGVRVVHTKTHSQAWDAPIVSIAQNGAFNYTATYGEATSITQDGDYTYVLPSANFVWHFTDDLLLRLGAAKTMARPSVEQLAPTSTTASVSWGEFTKIYGGNVNLKPYTAKQGDASLEWYFSEHSIANLAVFYKRIDNQITTSWESGQDIGVGGITDAAGNVVTQGPTLFNVQRPINGDYAKVHGIEAGLQHFWDNGLGFRAQYTRNWSESWVDGEKRPLEGIAPSVYSLSLMYEKGPWDLGVTADHTDGYVAYINVLGTGYNQEADPITWLTAHITYNINDMFSISLQGANLLDDAQTTTINGNRLLQTSYYRYGRSATLGVTLRF